MKIGLVGFEFSSANKGCEALVYSFLSIIQSSLKDGDVVFNFSGSELGIVPKYFRNIQFVNIPPRIKDIKFIYFRALKECDFIFDVTMGDSFSDLYSKNYYDNLIRHKRICQFFCKNYVLLPQTYGPFKENDSEKKANMVFKKAFRIYCRDELSQLLLKDKFDINKSELVSDMAFVLPYDKTMFCFSEKKKIGLNVSGLLYKGGFLSKNQFDLSINYQECIDKLLEKLLDLYEVHLIPHVIDLREDAYDDDYKICEIIHEKYPKIFLAPAFSTPIEAKSYISNMDVFIGSRMHSTIASFSSGVITIPISYSRKFEGLFHSLNYPYVIDGRKETTDSAIENILRYIEEGSILAKAQNKSLLLIKEKNNTFFKSISSLFKN